MDVCAKFHDKPSHHCWDSLVLAKTVDWSTDQHCHAQSHAASMIQIKKEIKLISIYSDLSLINLQKFHPLNNFAESVTSRSAVPSIADTLSLTLWQLQHHCPILPPVMRGNESRLWGVLTLQGPKCCCWGAQQGWVSLRNCTVLARLLYGTAHWVCRYVAQSEEWLQSFTDAQLLSVSLIIFFPLPVSVHSSFSPGKWPNHTCLSLTCSLTSLSLGSFLHSDACVYECISQPPHVKILHLLFSEQCVFCVSLWLAGWLTVFASVSWPGAWNGRWTAWQMAYLKEGFGGSDTVNWGLAPKQELGLLLVFPLLQSLCMDTQNMHNMHTSHYRCTRS